MEQVARMLHVQFTHRSSQPVVVSVVLGVMLTVSPWVVAQQNLGGPAVNRTPSESNPRPGVEGSATLRTYSVPSQMIGTVGAHLQLRYHSVPGFNVTTDPQTHQLMVMAPASVQQQVAEAIGRLLQEMQPGSGDQGQALATHQETTYQLKNLGWSDMEDALGRLAGSKLAVTTDRNGELATLKLQNQHGIYDVFQIDRRANQVTIMGTRPTVAAWMQVIYSLDMGQADAKAATHVVPLAPAKPRNIQRMIQLVRANVPQEEDELDSALLPGQDASDEAVTALGSVDTLSSASGLLGDVQIEVIPDIGLIIVKGSKRDVQRALAGNRADQVASPSDRTVIDVLPLQHANAEAVADEVTRLYDNIYQPRQGSVSITALGQPNALLIIGRQEIVDSVKLLVEKLDQPLDPQDQMKVIRLKHASAVDLETRVRDFFVQRPGAAQEERRALGTRVKVVSDFRTNSLIIQASPRELIEVEKLILQLDVEGSDTENLVQVFRLRHALAEDLQRVIQDVVSGQVTGQTGTGAAQATTPSSRLSLLTVEGGKVDSGVLAGVVVTADPSVNALVVKAPATSMPLLSQLINELDSLPNAEAQVKIFQLRNSDATTIALTLQNLYGLAPTAGQGAQFSLQNNLINNMAPTGLTGGGESSLVQLRVTPEAPNSVIASGGGLICGCWRP